METDILVEILRAREDLAPKDFEEQAPAEPMVDGDIVIGPMPLQVQKLFVLSGKLVDRYDNELEEQGEEYGESAAAHHLAGLIQLVDDMIFLQVRKIFPEADRSVVDFREDWIIVRVTRKRYQLMHKGAGKKARVRFENNLGN